MCPPIQFPPNSRPGSAFQDAISESDLYRPDQGQNTGVLVGTRKALALAVKNQDTSQRQTLLKELLQ